MKQPRFAIAASLLTIASLAAIWAWRATHSDAARIQFVTSPIQRGPLYARVTATGSVSARVVVQVGSQVSGRIDSLQADFNSVVQKGQVIALISKELFEADLEQAKANLFAAQGSLARAQIEAAEGARKAKRANELHEKGLASKAEQEAVRAAADSLAASLKAAEGVVAQARAAVNHAQINLGYTVITSPIDGTVISRTVDVGQTVAASMTAPVLFLIAQDLKKMQVHTAVAESDVGKLFTGMPAIFAVDAYPGDTFGGELNQIRNAPQLEQGVVTYDAVLDVDNTDLRLKPGMTANVSFIHAQSPDALSVPNAALRFIPPAEMLEKLAGTLPTADPAKGERLLWLLRGGVPVAVPVTLGISDGRSTEVRSAGLASGEAAITDAQPPKNSRSSLSLPKLFL